MKDDLLTISAHIKGLLEQARKQAIDQYTKAIRVVKNEDNFADRYYKNADGPSCTIRVTYLCLQCPRVSATRERHSKGHGFSVESTNGFIYCHECEDFIYDPTFEEIRDTKSKKRKQSDSLSESDRKLVASNTTATPCAATGLRGFYNMGQTCFMSVILQSLIHNPLIRAWYLCEGHKSSECERDCCTSCSLDDIFTDFFGSEKHEGYGAVHMLQACWKGGGSLAGYSQQDAHEFLGFILDSLHEAITDSDEKEDGNDTQKKTESCDCIIHQTFSGLMRSTVTCSECKNTNTTSEPFMDLSLDIKTTGFVTKKKKLALTNAVQTIKEAIPMDLRECLDRFTSTETLTSENYTCRKCNAPKEAKKKLSLTQLPPVLPIHLKRFAHSKTKAESNKVNTTIRFPFSLDMSPWLSKETKAPTTNGHHPEKNDDSDDGDTIDVKPAAKKDKKEDSEPQKPIFELSSVVVHKGKIDNGHYISYSRQGNEWFRFDDEKVVQVEEREVLQAEAYMLFYVIAEF